VTERTRARLGALLSLGLLALALGVLRRELAGHGYRDLAASFSAVPGSALLAAGLATVVSYALLALYDPLAVAWLGLRVPRGRAALAGLLGTAFSNTAGHSMLVGAPVRLRLYSGLGLDPATIAGVTLFSSLTVWVGYLG
jgi:phosphatidylglycerol lysyltransferase